MSRRQQIPSAAEARRAGRAEALFEKAKEKELRKVSGITRHEDGPRIQNRDERVLMQQGANAAGQAFAATRAGFTPAASGKLLQDRRAFADDLRKTGGETNADVMKRAAGLGLREEDVSSFVQREGIAAAAPANKTVGSTAVPLASGSLSQLTSSSMPKGLKSAATTVGGATPISSGVGWATSGVAGALRKLTAPKPPESKINGMPTGQVLYEGSQREKSAYLRGEGPQPFGPRTDAEKQYVETNTDAGRARALVARMTAPAAPTTPKVLPPIATEAAKPTMTPQERSASMGASSDPIVKPTVATNVGRNMSSADFAEQSTALLSGLKDTEKQMREAARSGKPVDDLKESYKELRARLGAMHPTSLMEYDKTVKRSETSQAAIDIRKADADAMKNTDAELLKRARKRAADGEVRAEEKAVRDRNWNIATSVLRAALPVPKF
jgi:hypothetical protein